jgi:hypothetical protein
MERERKSERHPHTRPDDLAHGVEAPLQGSGERKPGFPGLIYIYIYIFNIYIYKCIYTYIYIYIHIYKGALSALSKHIEGAAPPDLPSIFSYDPGDLVALRAPWP